MYLLVKIFPSDLKPIELLTVIKPSLVTDHELKRGGGRREERGEKREEGGGRGHNILWGLMCRNTVGDINQPSFLRVEYFDKVGIF